MSEDRAEYNANPQPPADPQPQPQPSEAEQKLSARVTELEEALKAREAQLSEAQKAADAQAADYASLKTSHDEAVKAYRKLAVSSNPLFTEDIITGTSVAEIDASMAKISDLAAKVRSKVEADIKSVIIPAGAPERSGPDTSGLSPREKIKQGLEETKK